MTMPAATYRLQLGAGVDFAAVSALLPHLVRLGVTHVYVSPVTEAVPGSTHGYDVTDHETIRGELGGRDAFVAMAGAAHAQGLGLVLDIVPNHSSVAVPAANRRWWRTLEFGRDAPEAATFDIDWDAGDGQVLLPVLDGSVEDAIAAGDLAVVDVDGERRLDLRGMILPLAAGTDDLVLVDALPRQHYRLVPWRGSERNVRRFFTIDDLVGLRTEDATVAEIVNGLPAGLVADGLVDGIRVDHVDGMAEPGPYLTDLAASVPGTWIVVEKILAAGEELPAAWPVAGTTGYEFLRDVDHLLLDPTGETPLTALWHEVSGDGRSFAEVRQEARREVLAGGLAADLDRVAALAERALPDVPAGDVRTALVDLTVHIGRYRTYQPDDPEAGGVVRTALESSRPGRPADATTARLAELLAAPVADTVAARKLQVRWQQLTAPVVAKGDEDRAFYRYLRLAALCEVGGEPGRFGLDADAFHEAAAQTLRNHPYTLLAGSTHDTKWSEDVRARLLVLSERPDHWRRFVTDAMGELRRRRSPAHPVDAYMALQATVGAWPIDAERLGAQLVKAAREAGLRTGWIDADERYEDRLRDLAGTCTGDGELAGAVEDFVGTIAVAGWSNSLAALVLRLAAPGIPDVYQGCETWNLSLVDPDNRRTPDWKALRHLAEAAPRTDPAVAWRHPADGLVKTTVLRRTLDVRRRRPGAFGADGTYEPIWASGARADHVISFTRGGEVVVAVTRCSTGVADGWAGTSIGLPDGDWRDALGDEATVRNGTVMTEALFGRLPVVVLERVG